MSRALKRGASVAGLLAALLCAGPARALEPIDVTVEAAVPIEPDSEPSELRRAAEARALEQAVLEVALRYVSEQRFEEDIEGLRKALAGATSRFVLTYRLAGAPTRRSSQARPGTEEYAVTVTAVVDAARLRETLQELGFLRMARPRPSIALLVQLDPEGRVPVDSEGRPLRLDLALEPLEQFLSARLAEEEFVIVQPALYAATGAPPRTAVELARSLGADVGVGVEVAWRPVSGGASGTVRGGVAEARMRSVRASDAVELASTRFEAPGYSPNASQAFERAVTALQEQLASSLIFQLEQNLAAVDDSGGAVRVRLSDVGSLNQVERVQQTLLGLLGAREARLALLEPRAAELIVEVALSPGALQERMVGAPYDGFGLELVGVTSAQVELRVVPRSEPSLLDAPEAGGGAPAPRTN